jgi:hypothetical protein
MGSVTVAMAAMTPMSAFEREKPGAPQALAADGARSAKAAPAIASCERDIRFKTEKVEWGLFN